MLIFYQSDRPVSLNSPAATSRIFDEGRQALAIQHGARSSVGLIASDSMLSPAVMLSCHVVKLLSHSAFGFYQPTTDLLVGFKGEHRDAITGLYGLGAGYRWYSTVLMRFLNPDSFSPFGEGGISAYAYVHNDPVNLIDPDGKNAQLPSVFFGKKFNYIKNLKRLKAFDQEYGIYKSKGGLFKKPALVIHSHASTDAIQVGTEQLTAKGFTDWLKSNNIKVSNYRKAIFATCMSGLPSTGKPIFAQEFSSLNKIKTNAYPGIIYTSITEHPKPGRFILGVLSKPFPGLFPDPHPNFTKFPRVYSAEHFFPQKNQDLRGRS